MNYRESMKNKLYKLLDEMDYVHAAWEGGSAATGYLDEFSDIDLIVICDDDKIEDTFKAIEKNLTENYGLKLKYRVPEPAWHGMSQCFYLLNDSPEFFFVDLAVQKLSADDRFAEEDRHGKAVVWFDKKNLVDSTPTPEDEMYDRCKNVYHRIADSFFLIEMDVRKCLKRGNFVDALESYFRGAIGRLAFLLNLTYRPAKYDFNLRYSYRDYPQAVNDKLKDLMLIKNEDDLLRKIIILNEWFIELKNQLKDRY